ncbi:MAG: cell division protein FtsQ/DivIB [Paludibacteraceae bacterium]|nr:cell division protein FtsQ/DivIB [Paludibacteraceae bacterium]
MEMWKKITLAVSASLVLCYLALSTVFLSGQRPQNTDEGAEPDKALLKVVIQDEDERRFISEKEVNDYLTQHQILPNQNNLSADRCHEIELRMMEHPMIREAACFPMSNGSTQIRLTQREPKMRVMGQENFFVDSERQIMPVRNTTATDVPLVTGRVSRTMAANELFDFVQWIDQHEFWSAQIAQIDVAGPNRIELIPRVGDGVILLGSLDDYQQKLKKLETLYTRCFSRIGWKNYKEIDLRYHGQIVCR